MEKFIVSAAITGGMAVAALGLAGAAAAQPGSAADTVASLQAQGYSVQLNGAGSVPLSDCTVTAVHGVSDSNSGGTVYVDTSCRGGC